MMNMNKSYGCKLFTLVIAAVGLYTSGSFAADAPDLDTALRNTYTSCVGIDESLSELKKLAGINTAVTGVGTALGIGAVATGIAKERTDKDIAEMERHLQELENAAKNQDVSKLSRINISKEQIHAMFAEDEAKAAEVSELEKLNKKSKKLGNWRTGLMAGSAATNVAGAIIAHKNQVDEDLQTQIDNCKESVKILRDAINAARIAGEDVTEANNIVNACREFEYVDISPINKRGKGAMISSMVGATTGIAGTVTSAMANSDATRNDNSDSGKEKEKNLNTTSNVLAGATTVASATATVFNATQISAIKKVSAVASACTEVLK